jgi:NADPH:quinone reductase-like Zn-dependent oxidoreductase
MRAAGVRQLGGPVELLRLPPPRALRADEVLIDVQACGAGNWDEFVRTGGWDTGARPPMALGVEAAGLVTAVGNSVEGVRVGDVVTTYSLPLREQGSWAEKFIAAAGHVAVVPPGVPVAAAAALPVPALTADQALTGGIDLRRGQTILVNGASGVTGGMLVQLAAHRGARVLATSSPGDAARVSALGADIVVDYHQPGWPQRVISITGGADAAVNAAPTGARDALQAVRDGGRLATITGDPPAAERGIAVLPVLVAPDGARLRLLAGLLGQGAIAISVAACYPLAQAGPALQQARHGSHGAAIVLRPGALATSR